MRPRHKAAENTRRLTLDDNEGDGFNEAAA